eukprot:TRINITY_DN4519_c0_g3_i3.p1 TRINITY_DN4519_c0_g3~~TRINITY_DN4519_c0_g3_i3.p1  ORF type:complete len:337 (-),score=72.74 TRINITY_DN4519_c0_g3_i3:163-1173(-)
MEGDKKPKTRKGKKILEKREPKLIEGIRHTAFLRGTKTSESITGFMHDLYLLKKSNSLFIGKRFDIKPFEDQSQLESLNKKNDTALFMFASHSKKRQNNVLLGRTYDDQVLDMFEFGLEEYQSIESFKRGNTLPAGCRPCLIFEGDLFEYDPIHIRMKNLFTDFFYENSPVKSVDIRKGIVYTIVITSSENNTIFFRVYSITQKTKSDSLDSDGTDIVEMGPRANLVLRRHNIANDERYKLACKKPKSKTAARQSKNQNYDNVGDKRGYLYVNQQDLGTLALRKRKKVKTTKNSKEVNALKPEAEDNEHDQEDDGDDGDMDIEGHDESDEAPQLVA